MSVIEDGKTYYIQYADNQRYVSLPKTLVTGTACEAVPIDEDKYYQKVSGMDFGPSCHLECSRQV